MPDGINPASVSVAFPPQAPLLAKPTDLVDAIIAALLPLRLDDIDLKSPEDERRVVEAMATVIGHYTVADAALAHRIAEASAYGRIYTGPENEEEIDRCDEALLIAREILERFICSSEASTPNCTIARRGFAVEFWNATCRNEENDRLLKEAVLDDLIALRSRAFDGGSTFGSSNPCGRGEISWPIHRRLKLEREIL